MSIKNNIVANFLGSAWSAVVGLAFVPYYIKMMGVEAYGLVGLMVSIQAIVGLLDLGLSQSLSREMSRLSVLPNSSKEMRDTVKSLEVVYWGIAIVVFWGLFLVSSTLLGNWLNPEKISRDELREALWIIALLIGVRWPISMYTGGLNGLQKQVLLNMVVTGFATFQAIGAIVALMLISPTINVFLLWQVFVVVIQVVVMRIIFMRELPQSEPGVFSKEVLRRLWRFAAGMSGITLTSILLMQSDKILLSKMLTLADFGYYTFAATIATIVGRITGPIFTAYYPKLTAIVSSGDTHELARVYHQGCQLLAVAVLPVALIGAFFSKEILSIWVQGDVNLVEHTALLVSLLILGNTLNGLLTFPYLLQLANGWTSLTFYINLALVVIALPAIYFATSQWGAVGAAAIWVAINASYVFVLIGLMHNRLLQTEMWRWYIDDVGKIVFASLLIVVLGKYCTTLIFNSAVQLLLVLITIILAFMSALFSSEHCRALFRAWINRGLSTNPKIPQ